jgi:hypothetical protein
MNHAVLPEPARFETRQHMHGMTPGENRMFLKIRAMPESTIIKNQ